MLLLSIKGVLCVPKWVSFPESKPKNVFGLFLCRYAELLFDYTACFSILENNFKTDFYDVLIASESRKRYAAILYPLKTPENKRFSGVFRGYKM